MTAEPSRQAGSESGQSDLSASASGPIEPSHPAPGGATAPLHSRLGNDSEPLLEVRDLKTYFYTDRGIARAVDGVSFRIPARSTLGLVGESGCGKSVSALSILRLIQSPPGKIVGGSIHFEGRNLLELSEEEIRRVRGNKISMIFQEPMTSLNPVFTIGDQITEAIRTHQPVNRVEALDRAIELLRRVRIPSAETQVTQYPHQISGGMRQRVMIAMALACNPKLLIADEPTTALDVTIQAQILELLRELQQEFGMSILLITHDLGVVAEMADFVAVMYAGQVVEYAPAEELFAHPSHPYTLGLFHSRPSLGQRKERLNVIPGTVPNPIHFPSGCRFHPRCSYVQDVCRTTDVRLEEVAPEHTSACLLVQRKQITLSRI